MSFDFDFSDEKPKYVKKSSEQISLDPPKVKSLFLVSLIFVVFERVKEKSERRGRKSVDGTYEENARRGEGEN